MGALEINAIRDYLIGVGCKIEYPILVHAFKKYLYNPEPAQQAKMRTLFKDYVNRLATVTLENNMKFIVLRPEFIPQQQQLQNGRPFQHNHQPPPLPASPQSQATPTQRQQPPPQTKQVAPQLPPQNSPKQLPPPPPPPHTQLEHPQPPPPPAHRYMPPPAPPIQQLQHSPQRPQQNSPRISKHQHQQQQQQFANQRPQSLQVNPNSMGPPSAPNPPPRRRQSTASLFKQPLKSIEKSYDNQELAKKSLGRVKEHALKFNSSPNDMRLHMPMRSNTMKENRLSRDSTFDSLSSALQRNGLQMTSRSRSSHREDLESDSSSLQPIDPMRRRWIIEACNCNYNGLLTLLREDQKLASYKDIVNGYTALHWAAKFGNLDIIKLIAGTYGVSANIKSSAGYTPLHVAAIFNRVEVADLLLTNYGANPDVRDHSGKRAKQYWPLQEEPMKKKLPSTPFK